MPKIFVLRNRLQEQQARLLETQKGQQIKIRLDELNGECPEQDQPVALIVDKKSDINNVNVSINDIDTDIDDKDNSIQRASPQLLQQQQQQQQSTTGKHPMII